MRIHELKFKSAVMLVLRWLDLRAMWCSNHLHLDKLVIMPSLCVLCLFVCEGEHNFGLHYLAQSAVHEFLYHPQSLQNQLGNLFYISFTKSLGNFVNLKCCTRTTNGLNDGLHLSQPAKPPSCSVHSYLVICINSNVQVLHPLLQKC